MTSEPHPSDVEFVRALEEHINELRATGVIKFRPKEAYSATEAREVLGSFDKDYITDLCKAGKIYEQKIGNAWAIPKHHLARYARALWADQWSSYEPIGSSAVGRSVSAGGLTLDEIEEQTGVSRHLFEKAFEEGVLPFVLRDGETFVFRDDLDAFIEVNNGKWVEVYYEVDSPDEEGVGSLGRPLAFKFGSGVGRIAPDARDFDESKGHVRGFSNVWGTLAATRDCIILDRLAFPGDSIYPS